MDSNYDTISIIKDKFCRTIVNTKSIRDYITREENDIDPEEPLSYIYKSVLPYKKNPKAVTNSNTYISMVATIKKSKDYRVDIVVNIFILVHESDMKTNLNKTKLDHLGHEVKKAICEIDNGTWLGDITFGDEVEDFVENHCYRIIPLYLKDIDMGRFIQNG